MKYTLITPKGRIYVFTVKACAEIFQQAYGGTLVSEFENEQCSELQRDVAGEEF